MASGADEKGNVRFADLPSTIPFCRQILDQGAITREIAEHPYEGSGTEEDPYVATFIDNDPRNPLLTPPGKKWMYALVMAFACLAVSFISSAFSGGIPQFMLAWGASQEVTTLGLSLFVLGFAIGPLLWAPLSELYGRQILYWTTFGAFAVFNAGVCGSENVETMIILRFFAGAFGSSPLTNAGGVIADTFAAKERGLAMSIFAAAPFMGPVFGPIVGGFLGENADWTWLAGLMAMFAAVMFILGALLVPETYAPVLLHKRAVRLSKMTGKVYKSQPEIDRGSVTLGHAFMTSLSRPWILLFTEPIVLSLSIFMAIIYGTLYMLFGAFPIVYVAERGWSQGIGGLAFIGVALGMIMALLYSIFIDDKRYLKEVQKAGGYAKPEARLPPCIIGGCALPIGLFWFAWTNSPELPWAASVAAGIPFGFGMVLLFLSIINYLIDSYTIFAASVLAASSVIRSLFGAAFPLFTTQMYDALGIHWASSIPAFLALACVPFPFLFYKYGESIRMRCKYAAEADAFMKKLRGETVPPEEEAVAAHDAPDAEYTAEDEEAEEKADRNSSPESGTAPPPLRKVKTHRSAWMTESGDDYHPSPYDIDRVNTRESFGPRASPSSRVLSRGVSRQQSRR